jgi:hypothetical protein
VRHLCSPATKQIPSSVRSGIFVEPKTALQFRKQSRAHSRLAGPLSANFPSTFGIGGEGRGEVALSISHPASCILYPASLPHPIQHQPENLFQKVIHKDSGCPTPLLKWPHVNLKNNLKSCLPTEDKDPLRIGPSRPCGVTTGLKVRPVTARPEGPGKRPHQTHPALQGRNIMCPISFVFRTCSPGKNHAKYAHFPSGTDRNRARNFSVRKDDPGDELLLPIIGRVPISALPSLSKPSSIFHLRKCLSIKGAQSGTNGNQVRKFMRPIGLKARNVIALTSIIDPAGPGIAKEVFSRSVRPEPIPLTKMKPPAQICHPPRNTHPASRIRTSSSVSSVALWQTGPAIATDHRLAPNVGKCNHM